MRSVRCRQTPSSTSRRCQISASPVASTPMQAHATRAPRMRSGRWPNTTRPANECAAERGERQPERCPAVIGEQECDERGDRQTRFRSARPQRRELRPKAITRLRGSSIARRAIETATKLAEAPANARRRGRSRSIARGNARSSPLAIDRVDALAQGDQDHAVTVVRSAA